MISAARADGSLSPQEQEAIVEQARAVGADQLVDYEMRNPRPLADIAAGVRDAKTREEMYAMAFAVVRADESVTGAERIYLAQLAHALGLDPAAAARIEGVAAAGIDAAAKGRGMSGAAEWYMAIGGHQVGPVSADEIVAQPAQRHDRRRDAGVQAGDDGLDADPRGRGVPRPGRRPRPPARWPSPRCRGRGAPTRSGSLSTARTCSSSRWSSIPARARSRKRAR